MSYNIVEYSDKSFTVQTNPVDLLKLYSTQLKQYGKYNPNLKKGAGWIFPKSKQSQIDQLLSDLISDKYEIISCLKINLKLNLKLKLYVNNDIIDVTVTQIINSFSSIVSTSNGVSYTCILKNGWWIIPTITTPNYLEY